MKAILDCRRGIGLFDTFLMDFLINLAERKHPFLEQAVFGRSNLQAYLLDTLFEVVLNRDICRELDDRRIRLALDGLKDARYAHLAYRFLYQQLEENGWNYLPDLMWAASINPNIDLRGVIGAFVKAMPNPEGVKIDFPAFCRGVYGILPREKFPFQWFRLVGALNSTGIYEIDQPYLAVHPDLPRNNDDKIFLFYHNNGTKRLLAECVVPWTGTEEFSRIENRPRAWIGSIFAADLPRGNADADRHLKRAWLLIAA
jgi:hypothetical protein